MRQLLVAFNDKALRQSMSRAAPKDARCARRVSVSSTRLNVEGGRQSVPGNCRSGDASRLSLHRPVVRVWLKRLKNSDEIW